MKINISVILEYLFTLFLILDGFSVYMTPQSNRVLFTALSLGVLILMNMFSSKHKNKMGRIPYVLSFLALIYFVQDIKDIILGTVLFVLGLPLLIRYIWKCRLERHSFSVLYRIDDWIVFLTICSITLWLLGPVFDFIKPNMFFKGSWGAWTYKENYVPGYCGLLFLTQMEDGTFLNNEIWRNTSIFAEGPMFNLWLCIGFSITLFLRKSLSKIRVIVYILGVLSTFSSTGFIFLSITGIYYLAKTGAFAKLQKNIFFRNLIYLFGIVLSLILVKMILSQKADSTSYLIRMNEYTNAFNSFKSNPLFGVGYKRGAEYEFGMSNSLLSILGCGGIWVFSITYYPLVCVLRKFKTENFRIIGIAISFLILSLSTNFYTQFVFILFPAFLYSLLIKKKIYE